MQISLHEVEGQVLRVGIRRGEKARPPLLLFNGIGANIELVEPFLDALDGPEAIIFDVPGVGGSPSPWLPYRPSTLARLSAGLLDQLGHAQVDVLGLSWGGALAQQFAFQQGKRCRRLVLAATSPGHRMVPAKLTVLL
jgi:pimeloyl-ACP methyl ester carboxylesterase